MSKLTSEGVSNDVCFFRGRRVFNIWKSVKTVFHNIWQTLSLKGENVSPQLSHILLSKGRRKRFVLEMWPSLNWKENKRDISFSDVVPIAWADGAHQREAVYSRRCVLLPWTDPSWRGQIDSQHLVKIQTDCVYGCILYWEIMRKKLSVCGLLTKPWLSAEPSCTLLKASFKMFKCSWNKTLLPPLSFV